MKIIKSLLVVLLIAGVAVVFYSGATGMAYNPEKPLGELNHMLEAPDASYKDKVKFKMEGEGALNGGFSAQSSEIDKAMFLLYTATFNENWLDQYAWIIKAKGTADYSGLGGELISNSVHIKNADQNFEYHRWINALDKLMIPSSLQFLEGVLRPILAIANETVSYQSFEYRREGNGKTQHNREIGLNIAQWDQTVKKTKEEAKPLKEITAIEQAFEEVDKELNRSYGIKSYVNFYNLIYKEKLDVIKSLTFEEKQDSKGNAYYDIKIIGNVDEINKDETTLKDVVSENSPAQYLKFLKYNLRFQVWKDTGIFRMWETDEDWEGGMKVVIELSAATKMNQPATYSYHPDDCNPKAYLEGFEIIEPSEKK